MTIERMKLEAMLRARWREQTRLIATAGQLMNRCLDAFHAIIQPDADEKVICSEMAEAIFDMETWLKEMKHHIHNLDTDMEELG